MSKYLYTSDLRISELAERIRSSAQKFASDISITDKSEANNAATLQFYFNLEKGTKTLTDAIENPVSVIRNYMLKFQFPNPRTPESLADAIEQRMFLAPYRAVTVLLWELLKDNGTSSESLSCEEILYYVFCNPNVYTNPEFDVRGIIAEINSARNSERDYEHLIESNLTWNQYGRQSRELLTVFTKGCSCFALKKGYLTLDITNATSEDLDFITQLRSNSTFWFPSNTSDFQLAQKEYISYMDTNPVPYSVIQFDKPSKPFNAIVGKGSLQQIYYGAPGTGKSHIIKEQTRGKNVIRTTFHPDSDYSTFVGAYKPTTKEVILRDLSGHVVVENGQPVKEEKIVYEFVSQAFLQSYVNAWKAYADAQQGEVATEQYLVIEEINRGNCAQIFGDLFQLLDRNDNGFSDYPIKADNDMQKQLAKAFKGIDVPQRDSINALYDEDDIVSKVLDGEVLLLPNNLYIWATMNTSDQSLFPIDSAFKRRWDWKYMPINNAGMKWRIAVNGAEYDWWQFLTKVNEYIGSTTNSEDKKLGYFFCKTKNGKIDAETFVGKVIFYLWNDVFKDYGFDGILFQAADGSTLTFDKFYGDNAMSINEDNVAQFLNNLGVKAIELSNDYDVEDGDIDVEEKKSYSYPDYSRYTFNGSQPMGKGPLGTAIIAKFVTEHKDMTFAQLKAELTDELLRPEPNKGLLFDISSDDKRYSKDYEPTEYVSSDGVRFVASKRWNINNVSNIIGFARKQGWEINDAEPYQRNNQYLEK